MSIDLHRLRCFLAVATEQHFGRAAERLQMTPAPLSRQIKQLESELRGDLFVRSYHAIELTPFGRAMLEVIREAVRAADAVVDTASRLQIRGLPIRVGATPYAPTDFVDNFLDFLRDGGALIDDHVALGVSSVDLARQITAGALDLAFVHTPSPDDALNEIEWQRYRLAIAVRRDDPLSVRRRVTVLDLRGRTVLHPLARLNPKTLAEHRRQLEDAGVDAQFDLPGPVGSAEIATQVWSRHIAAFVPDLPDSLLGRVFRSSQFVTIPVEGDLPEMTLGAIWSASSAESNPTLHRAVALLRARAVRGAIASSL